MVTSRSRVSCILAAVAATLTLLGSPTEAGQDLPELERTRGLIEQGSYAEAERAARELLETKQTEGGAESLDIAEVLDVLVEARLRDGRIYDTEVRELAEHALRLKETFLGPADPGIAISLLNLASVIHATEGPRAAWPLCEHAVEIAESAADELLVARVLAALADVLTNLGKLTEAERLFERALEIQEERLGECHLQIADTLYLMGWYHYRSGDYAAAGLTHERARSIVEQEYGSEHPRLARNLAALGHMVFTQGDLARAQPLLEQALAIAEESYGTEHALVGAILTHLAKLQSSAGRLAEAESLFRQSLAIREEIQGPDHFALIPTLNGLGSLLYGTGGYTEARVTYERALSIIERHYGPDHTSAGWILGGYGNLLRRTGDDAGARSAFERAVAIAEGELGNESLLAASLLNLAYLEQVTSHYGEARQLYERVLPLLKERFGPEHEWVMECMTVYGELLVEMGEFLAAREMLERALELRQKVFGAEHVDVGHSMRALAVLLHRMGDFAGARRFSEKALAIEEKALGPDAPKVGWSLTLLSRALLTVGERQEALSASLRAERIARDNLRLSATTMPEREALAFASTSAGALQVALSVLTLGDAVETTGPAGEVWDSVIQSRALVLDEMASRHRSVVRSDDPTIAGLAAELVSARTRLARLFTGRPGRGGPEQYRARIGEAREEKERLERALAEKSAEFRAEQARQRIGLAEVAVALPPNSALVAFVVYRRSLLHDEQREQVAPETIRSYLVLVLQPDAEGVTAIPLGPTETINGLVRKWRVEAAADPRGLMGAAARAEARYRQAGTELREAIWDPVTTAIGTAEQVFVVSDGALNLVNLAALPHEDGSYLIEKDARIHYLSAERDLVPVPSESRAQEGLLAMGGPAFDATSLFATLRGDEEEVTEIVANVSDVSAAAEPSVIRRFRGQRSSCDAFDTMRFEPLPASAREVTELTKLWQGAHAALEANGVADVTLRSKAAASEEAFKALAPGHEVVHIATHGFFLGGRCASAIDDSIAGENPLLLSGLALAGANHRDAAGADEDDGILTAEEIAALDLTGVEWTVLSACDTGVGHIRAGEGVFGLRRAFQLAGAGTLIMSLWSVDDEAAREWMRGLYEGRLSGLHTSEAVKQASLSMIDARRRAGRSTHPFYWGAFVATGDWK